MPIAISSVTVELDIPSIIAVEVQIAVGVRGAAGPPGTTTWIGITDKPASFPPSAHTHPSTDINDSQATGRALIEAATPEAGRSVLELGTAATHSESDFEPAGSVAAHIAASDPHPQYATLSEAAAAAPVQSVAGRGGNVVLVKGDVGLGNADDTADTAKPVSTAQATADSAAAEAAVAEAAGALALHVAASDPHPQYLTAADVSAAPVLSVAGRVGNVVLAKGDVGLASVDNTADSAKPVSTAQAASDSAATATAVAESAAALASHVAASDPHPQYTTDAEAAAAAPVQSVAGRGGNVILTKGDVGLGSADNTADSAKPVSTAQAAADSAATASAVATAAGALTSHIVASDPHPQYTTDVEAAAAAPVQSVAGRAGNVVLTKGDVGLGSADNTADSAKPVSTAQAAADSAATAAAISTAAGALASHLAASDPHPQYTTDAEAAAAAPVQSVAGRAGNVVLAKGDVGLGSTDNTADSAKPVSTAQAAADSASTAAAISTAAGALASHVSASDPHPQYTTDAEAAAASPVQSVAGRIGNVVLAKGDVGLGSTDNTADVDKPVSTAQAAALAGKAATADIRFKGGLFLGLSCGYTPSAVGADPNEVTIPYSKADGTTVLTWTIRRITFRVATAGGSPSMRVEKSTVAGGFSAATVATLTIAAGDSRVSTTASLGTVSSGDTLRFNALDLGSGAAGWTVTIELGESS